MIPGDQDETRVADVQRGKRVASAEAGEEGTSYRESQAMSPDISRSF